jgi:hypothetical protein
MFNRDPNKSKDDKVETEESPVSEDSESEIRNESNAESLEEYNQREQIAAQASKLQFEYVSMIQDLSHSPMKFVLDPTRTFSSKDKGDRDSFISFGYARRTQEEKDNPNIIEILAGRHILGLMILKWKISKKLSIY